MKFWKWIKSLKVPRLIIEAILIFASVYFALILEADRSKDFEREVLILELKSLNKRIQSDLVWMNDKIVTDQLNFLSYHDTLDKYLDSIAIQKPVNYRIYDKIEKRITRIIYDIPPEVDKIKEYHYLIQSVPLKNYLMTYSEIWTAFQENEHKISNWTDDFATMQQWKSKVYSPYQSKKEIFELVNSAEYFGYVLNLSFLVGKRKYFSKHIPDSIERLKEAIWNMFRKILSFTD
jgi:hypothetical protein